MKASNYLVVALLLSLLFTSGVSAITQTSYVIGGYTHVKFSGAGTMNWTPPPNTTSIYYLLVGGGGSGGAYYGGGGGGGGVATNYVYPIANGTPYTITVGAGGAAVTGVNNGTIGTNSTITNGTAFLSVKGGGYGGHAALSVGGDGGSGGGAGGKAGAVEYAGGSNVSGQGFPGGYHETTAGFNYFPSAGGGGAGAKGGNATTDEAGNGGTGVISGISGVNLYYGGGGGGCMEENVGLFPPVIGFPPGTGGAGGGGDGSNNLSYNALPGTDGYGGGGGGVNNDEDYSGKGGDGVVFIRYENPYNTATYSTAGTYYWESAADITLVTVSMGAGGGGGSAGKAGLGINRGVGGSAGERTTLLGYPVIGGTNYTIVVGAGGPASTTTGVSYPGTNTTAFGYTMDGGAGGVFDSFGPQGNGTDGTDTGFLNSTQLGDDGGDAGIYFGGIGGIGHSAGGGGGAAYYDGVITYVWGSGGKGADGVVSIEATYSTSANVPNFSASPTTGNAGSIINFYDTSTIYDNQNLTYHWDFGDGSVSSVIGSTTHVYSYYGVYTVNLSIASDIGNFTTTKTNLVTISSQTGTTTWYSQKLVRFKIVDAYGNDLPGASVSATYINTTLPSRDSTWLTTAFGISAGVAEQMMNGSLAMQGTTGSDGSLSFMMFPAIQYGITITNATAGLSKYVTVYPQDNDYIIRCPLTSQTAPISVTSYLYNTSLYVTEPNASWITWNIIYSDTSGYTAALRWNVTCWNNMTEMYNKSWGALTASDVVADNYTFPSVPAGVEYRAIYDATRSIP